MVGNTEAIYDVIKHLRREGLVPRVINGLQDYTSLKIWFLEDKKQAWLGQPYLYVNLEKIGKQVMGN